MDRFRTDEHGFCNEPGKAAAGMQDIVSIGGSIPNCVAIPAKGIFTAVLQHKTGKRVYNLGVGGVGPYEYLEILSPLRFGVPPSHGDHAYLGRQ